ncbi:MAG: ATP-binding domain-containing protein [Myxococcales bacterium]|nr:ATP-binding domain-containing protein [Myxococcales bacterium]
MATPDAPPPAEFAVPGLEGDPEGTRIVQDEARLLAMVQRVLFDADKKSVETLRARQGDDARLLELRDDVAVAKPEDLPALFEQMHHVGALRAQRGKGAEGAIDRQSPYFGHLRLDEGGKRRDVLVGSRSYVDTAAGIRIVDWRQAPVSRIFYRYMEGDDYEERLGDRLVEGEVVARRSVAIVGGELVRVTAPQGTFVRKADGRWDRVDVRSARLHTERRALGPKAALDSALPPARHEGRASAEGAVLDTHAPDRHPGTGGDKHLPAIASMLDAAQFDLITRPGMGIVAVQGSAGSGKTTVGLHRVAYLAFADPDRYRADKMLVVVPNDALLHYVKRVLPELGVEGVTLTTFARFSTRVLPLHLPKLPTRLSDDTPPVVVRAKTHPAMLRAIHRAVEALHLTLDAHVEASLARWPEGGVAIDAWRSTRPEKRDATDVETTPEQRVTAFAAWFAGRRKLGARAAAELPDVTRGAIEKLGHDLRRRAQAVLSTWDELLTSRPLLEETFQGAFPPQQIDRIHDWCVKQARIRADGERDGEIASIDLEDVPILLRIWQVVRGPLTGPDQAPLKFTHLFVDEVQDASPLELRVLLDLATKDRSITLAGDTAQRMLDDDDDRGEFDWQALLRELGHATTTLEPLKVSYRSTAEITKFARGVLGSLAHESEPIATRHGPPVELFHFSSAGEVVAFLADALKELARAEPYANVALVARFPQQADVYFEGLERAEVPRVRRVAKQDFTWDPGFDVTDVRQTKGLEFDEVVLLETTQASYPSSPQARHALYVGATRAAHQLWCTASEKPSLVVEEALRVDAPA